LQYVKDNLISLVMLDNKLVQIALVFLAFYVILQMMNGQVSQEHLDTVVQVQAPPASQTQVQIQQPSAAISTTIPAPANSLVTPELAATSSTASATPIVTSSPSAAITTKIPSPLTSVEEDLVAAAPKILPEDQLSGKQNANIFAPEPSLEAMFGRRAYLDPADLIPKTQDAELYGGLAPDPRMNQNFLTNRWSIGLDTSIGSFNSVQDLRGMPYLPSMKIVSPWNLPSKMPDLYRKSLADIT
jgi:hypothetical protein